MSTRPTVAMVGAAVLIAVTPGFVGGCSSLGRLYSASPSQGPVKRQVPAVVPAPPEDDSNILAAVEAFLERTREYDAAPSTIAGRQSFHPRLDALGGRDAVAQATPLRSVLDPGSDSRGLGAALANAQVTLSSGEPTGQPLLALPVVESLSIATTPTGSAPAPEPALRNAANQPLDVHTAGPSSIVDRFVSYLRERAEERADSDGEWALRLALTALQRNAEATEVSDALPLEVGRLLPVMIRAVIAVRAAARDPLLNGKEALSRVDRLHRMLADRADPVVSSLALCRKVVAFGVYEEMSDTEFVAGRTAQTIVYAQIDNLRSEETEDGEFLTRFATRLELLTAEGESAWRHEEPEIVDLCRRKRRDFFIALRIKLPPTLPAGSYVMKLLVEDLLSGRADEASHPLAISSALSMATSR